MKKKYTLPGKILKIFVFRFFVEMSKKPTDEWFACVICYYKRDKLKNMLKSRDDSRDTTQNRSVVIASRFVNRILYRMNVDNETQINAAYNKAEKKIDKGLDLDTQEDHKTPKRYEIACLVGPTTEGLAKKVVTDCKDDSRGRSHNVIGLLIAASRARTAAKKKSIIYSSNWNAVYQVDAVITEVPSEDDESVTLLFETPHSKKIKRLKKN